MGMGKAKERVADRDAWKAAEAYGFDMSLVESNLRRTPAERILSHCRALAFDEVLRGAVKQRNGSR
jgi:hypothetical protein